MNNIPKSLTQSDFEAIAAFCYDKTSRMVRSGKEVVPVVLAGTIDDGKISLAAAEVTPLETDRDKFALTALMGVLVERLDIDFVVHITEAWMLFDRTLPQGSIADHPKRQEAVIFNILSKDCQTVVMNPLHRWPPRLERGTVDFSVEVRGRMVREPETRN